MAMTDEERRELVGRLKRRMCNGDHMDKIADEIERLTKINRDLCLGWEQAERERDEARAGAQVNLEAAHRMERERDELRDKLSAATPWSNRHD